MAALNYLITSPINEKFWALVIFTLTSSPTFTFSPVKLTNLPVLVLPVSFSASFLLFPTNLTLMWFKILAIFIYFYISSKCVYKYKYEECVVGIISSALLLAINICY